MQQEIFRLRIFQEHNGAAGFFAKQQPFTSFTIALLILYSCDLKVMRKSTNKQVEHASVVVAALGV